jgi:ParB/RepB/Spo0J family partition protein
MGGFKMTIENPQASDKSSGELNSGEENGTIAPVESKMSRMKNGQTKRQAKKCTGILDLPNGCTLTEEVEIPVSELVITERRDEGGKAKIDLQNLSTSLKAVGQLYALFVRRDATTGKYSVLAGNRRLAAALLANIPSLRCRIFNGPDNALPHVISAIENAHRKSEAPWSAAVKLKAAMDEGFDQKQLADMFQKSKGAVSEMLYAVTKLPAAYRKRIEKGENLYKVVAEHKRAKKAGADRKDAVPTEQPTTAQVSEAAINLAAQVKSDIPSTPLPRYPYGFFEHGGVTINVSCSHQGKPNASDIEAALRYVLGILESREQEERRANLADPGVSSR